MKDERFIVTYRIEASSYEEAKAIAWAVQVEQTIEFPYEFVTDPYIKGTITGRLESLEPMKQDSAYVNVGVMPNAVIDISRYYVARISYLVDTTALEATQFLNVVFGNSSLHLIFGWWMLNYAQLFTMCLKDHVLVCMGFAN